MIKTIIALIPFAIFCLLGANLYVKYLVEKQFDEIEEELFKEQNMLNNKGSSILGILIFGFILGIGGTMGYKTVNTISNSIGNPHINHLCKHTEEQCKKIIKIPEFMEWVDFAHCKNCRDIYNKVYEEEAEKFRKALFKIMLFLLGLVGGSFFLCLILGSVCDIIYGNKKSTSIEKLLSKQIGNKKIKFYLRDEYKKCYEVYDEDKNKYLVPFKNITKEQSNGR